MKLSKTNRREKRERERVGECDSERGYINVWKRERERVWERDRERVSERERVFCLENRERESKRDKKKTNGEMK